MGMVCEIGDNMNDKPRIGRPKGDGTHRNIGVYGTPEEIAAVLELAPRERMEAMLAKVRNDHASAVLQKALMPAQGKE
jgi:hypothetical protein